MTIAPGMVLFILPRSVLSVQLLLPFFPPSGVLCFRCGLLQRWKNLKQLK